MKVWLPDLKRRGHSLLDLKDDFSFEYTEFNMDTQEFQVCRTGVLTDCRFQILFEIALNHFVRGQYRDVVVSAHASLERYREFYLLVSFVSNGIDISLFDKFWSKVSNQSERQFGAYHLMLMIQKKVIGKELSNSQVSYRNKVVHGGYFPTEDRTFDYCEAVLKIIQDGLGPLVLEEKESLQQAMQVEFRSRKPNNADYELSIKPFLDLSIHDVIEWTNLLPDHLSRLEKQPEDRITWPNFLYE